MRSKALQITYFFMILSIAYIFVLEIVDSVVAPTDNVKSDYFGSKQINNANLPKVNDKFVRYNRQLDSDVESRFHITPNTIIRTGESKLLGAKYINETILPSNHDCLTQCLETPNCNAAVYEEKDAQSCYMFNCGVSASLCSFTSHSFFISSILKFTQHSYDLSQWGNQIKHEQELQSLRNSDPVTQSTQVPTLEPKKIVSTIEATSSAPIVTESPCHHYQFKCLNSSECIAIYNVCDGIPQCPDGSDESIDLKCHEKEIKNVPLKNERPATGDTSNNQPGNPENRLHNSNMRPKVPQTLNTIQQNRQTNNLLPSRGNQQREENRGETRQSVNGKSIWPNRPPSNQATRKEYYPRTDDRTSADSDGLGSPFKHMHSQFVAANDPHVQNLNRWSNDYDQYPSHSLTMDQQYAPYEGGNYQRLDDQYNPSQLSPDYDSIKGYGTYRQEDIPYWTNQDTSFPVDAEYPQSHMHSANKQTNYPDKERLYAQQLARTADQYPEIKHHIMHKPPDPIPETPSQNIPSDLDNYKLQRISMQRQSPYLAYDDNMPKQLYPEIKPKNYPPRVMDDTLYNNDDLIRASIVNQLPIETDHSYPYNKKYTGETETSQQEKSNENHEEKELAKDSLIIVKPTTPAKSLKRTVLDFKMSVTELYQSSKTHTQETNSAILALVIGLTVSFLLVIFLVCRVKTIRKRMSRKGRALAHDADYLVNGMYL